MWTLIGVIAAFETRGHERRQPFATKTSFRESSNKNFYVEVGASKMNGARHLACILLLIFAAAWGSLQDDAIDEQVERILGQMSEEDDAYGIEPESTLKKLKTGEEIEEFVKVSTVYLS